MFFFVLSQALENGKVLSPHEKLNLKSSYSAILYPSATRTQRCTGSSLSPHVTCILHTARINNVERVLRVNRIRKIANTKFGGEMEKDVYLVSS